MSPRPARHQGSHRPLTLERLEDRSLLSGAPATLDLPGVTVDHNQADPSSLLVQFRPNAVPTPLPGTSLARQFDLVPGLYEVQLDPGAAIQDALEAYRRDARVIVAQPNYRLDVSWVPNDPR